jgi:hypothetical protein
MSFRSWISTTIRIRSEFIVERRVLFALFKLLYLRILVREREREMWAFYMK